MQKKKKVFLIATIVFIIDLLTKHLLRDKDISIIKGFMKLSYSKNYGAAWSILQNQRIVLIIVSVLFLVIIIRYLFKFKNNTRNYIAFGFLIGGLLGNLFDRVLLGYVRDFISLRFGNYYYPTFNVADSAIVIGVILLIVAIIKKEDSNAED